MKNVIMNNRVCVTGLFKKGIWASLVNWVLSQEDEEALHLINA